MNRLEGSERLEGVREAREAGAKERLAKDGLAYGAPVYLRIFKEERELELWIKKGAKYALFETYPIAAMSGRLGPKLAEGDGQAPEGFYEVPKSMLLPTSRYHLAFNIGFPNAYDRQNDRTGSFIMVHGSNQSIGCFAMTDQKIEEIYLICEAALKGGQKAFPVHSFPFRMTSERLQKASRQEWFPFWKELQPAYIAFEKTRVPPKVLAKGGKYLIEEQR